jgi:hypothetical protein
MLLDKPGREPGQGWGPGRTVSPPRCPGLRSASLLGGGPRDGLVEGCGTRAPRAVLMEKILTWADAG